MIATAAESNPSCFSPTPLLDLEETLVPSYLRLGKYLGNNWANTKFCALQFKAPHTTSTRSDEHAFKSQLSRAKSFDDADQIVGGVWTGEEEFAKIVRAIEARPSRNRDTAVLGEPTALLDVAGEGTRTPVDARPNPQMEDPLLAPLGPANERRIYIPAGVSGHDELTPTPAPRTQAV